MFQLTVGEKLKLINTVGSITSKKVTLMVTMVSNIDIYEYFANPFIYTDVNTRTDGVNKVQTID